MLKWLVKLFQSEPTKPKPPTNGVILRDIQEPRDSRSLTAVLENDGGLEFHGLDRGDAVQKYFGEREYEWRWHLDPEETTKLRQCLGEEIDLLSGLANRFRGDAAADLQKFFEANDIAYKVWSRTGD